MLDHPASLRVNLRTSARRWKSYVIWSDWLATHDLLVHVKSVLQLSHDSYHHFVIVLHNRPWWIFRWAHMRNDDDDNVKSHQSYISRRLLSLLLTSSHNPKHCHRRRFSIRLCIFGEKLKKAFQSFERQWKRFLMIEVCQRRSYFKIFLHLFSLCASVTASSSLLNGVMHNINTLLMSTNPKRLRRFGWQQHIEEIL